MKLPSFIQNHLKTILEISAFTLTVIILLMAFGAFKNFISAKVNTDVLKESSQFHISILNNLQTTVSHITPDNRLSFTSREIERLYSIQKYNDLGHLENVVLDYSVNYFDHNTIQTVITLRPSTHSCVFIQNRDKVKGELLITGVNKETPNCNKDFTVLKYKIFLS